MKSATLRRHVSASVREEWPAFERAHPNLARLIDEEQLVEAATEALREDEEFTAAVADARAAGLAASALRDAVGRFVRGFIRRLL